MSARVITQYYFDAYCPDCGFVDEEFDDEDDAQAAVDTHNRMNHTADWKVSTQ